MQLYLFIDINHVWWKWPSDQSTVARRRKTQQNCIKHRVFLKCCGVFFFNFVVFSEMSFNFLFVRVFCFGHLMRIFCEMCFLNECVPCVFCNVDVISKIVKFSILLMCFVSCGCVLPVRTNVDHQSEDPHQHTSPPPSQLPLHFAVCIM